MAATGMGDLDLTALRAGISISVRRYSMTRRQILLTSVCGFVIAVLAASFAGHQSALAVGPDQEEAELANALSGVKVSLQQAFTASEREGQPISGKFEMDEGKLQLSVYTAKERKVFEVIGDQKAGTYREGGADYGGEGPCQRQAEKGWDGKGRVKLAGWGD